MRFIQREKLNGKKLCQLNKYGSMNYEEQLVRSVKNPDGYLWFDNASTLSYLHGIADDSFERGTTEGYFTAAIICHQLTEKILFLLVTYSDLLIKAKMYPEELDTNYKGLDSCGKLMNRHEATLVFSYKARLLKNARTINKARNQMVHSIDELGHEENIDSLSKEIVACFESFFLDWKDAMKWFYTKMDSLRSQASWQELFEKYSLE